MQDELFIEFMDEHCAVSRTIWLNEQQTLSATDLAANWQALEEAREAVLAASGTPQLAGRYPARLVWQPRLSGPMRRKEANSSKTTGTR